jgi:hypothetical protein
MLQEKKFLQFAGIGSLENDLFIYLIIIDGALSELKNTTLDFSSFRSHDS